MVMCSQVGWKDEKNIDKVMMKLEKLKFKIDPIAAFLKIIP